MKTLAELNALVAQKEARLKSVREEMSAHLDNSEKDGVTPEEKAKHVAAFDAAKPQLVAAQGDLERAVSLRDAFASSEAHDRREREPGRPPLAIKSGNPLNPVGAPAIRSRLSRQHQLDMHGGSRLEAFKGEDARERAYQAGLWVAATMYGNQQARSAYEEQYGEIRTALTTTNNTGAAYFVPEILQATIIELVESFGVFRRYAEMVMMGSDSVTEPKWTTGLTAYFVAEGSAPSETDPAWKKVGLVAKNLAAYGKMSRNLNEDALVSLGDKWMMCSAVAFAEKEDDCGFNGDGTSTYGGITGALTKIIHADNAASLHTATGETTLAALTVGTLETFMGKLPEYPGIQPAFFCHKQVYHASLGRLKRTAGGVSMAEMTAGSPPTYAGYPVVFTQKMPVASSVTTGVTGILFGDLRYAAKFGERRERTFETGMDGNDFSKQLMSLLATQRFDINVHTLTDPRDSSKPGPLLGLKLG